MVGQVPPLGAAAFFLNVHQITFNFVRERLILGLACFHYGIERLAQCLSRARRVGVLTAAELKQCFYAHWVWFARNLAEKVPRPSADMRGVFL